MMTRVVVKLAECPACKHDINVTVQLGRKADPVENAELFEQSKDGSITVKMVPTGAEVSHNCIPKVTR